jgi:hypothetical protein
LTDALPSTGLFTFTSAAEAAVSMADSRFAPDSQLVFARFNRESSHLCLFRFRLNPSFIIFFLRSFCYSSLF